MGIEYNEIAYKGVVSDIEIIYRFRRKTMSREQRKKMAHETLEIQKQGYYIAPSGKRVDIDAAQRRSERASYLIKPSEGESLVNSLTLPHHGEAINASYEVVNESTVKTILGASKIGLCVAALNFASAKNPGGGFLRGAMAQEEALSYASGLHSTQICNMAYYAENRACESMTYTDHAIYSPGVVFFRDAENRLLETPMTCSILTLPAVNMGQVRAKGQDIMKAGQLMKARMRLCLAILAHEKNEVVILGAYGCGVFGNDPEDVARWWRELLIEEGFSRYFKRVIFAVLDKPVGKNIKAFNYAFKDLE